MKTEHSGPDVERFASTRHTTYPFISDNHLGLSGKSVMITGASKGIGRVIAIRFARSGCSRIALVARSSLHEVEAAILAAAIAANHPPPHIYALRLDVSSPESVKAAAAAIGTAFGGSLDVLITNAVVMEEWRTITEAAPEEWWRTWEVNLKGAFLCAHFFIPLLLKSESKILLTVSSAGAYKLGIGASSYNTSRLAACRFNEFIDHEYGMNGLISISVNPGNVKTDLSLRFPKCLLGNLVDDPELAADTMVWLSAERREWLSGRYISCNWDMEELESRKLEVINADLFKFRLAM
ncbi:hypothetical protein F5884DRAFT_804130 [Xylogone sp. PMI_703]|nr:hypothetical protein F5884DRAFT_804130 [Xylogone sp. PMI_703]